MNLLNLSSSAPRISYLSEKATLESETGHVNTDVEEEEEG